MKFVHKLSAVTFIVLLSAAQIYTFGKKDSSGSDSSDSSEVQKEHIKIELFLDTKNSDSKNHFKWETSKNKYNDSFDTVSGASKVHSTKNFRDTALDSTKRNLRTPKGLRNLCLYAVANPEILKKDGFSATKEGSKITITFTHRENSYKIESDENGDIMVPEGFFIKLKEVKKEAADSKNEGDSKTSEKESKASAEAQNTEEKASPQAEESDGFKKDAPDESLNYIFAGKLKAKLSDDGILTLKGKLNLQKREEPKKEAEETKPEEEKSEETGTKDEKESPAEEAPQD